MIWIIGAGCFLAGAAIGALLFKVLLSDDIRIRNLEEQLQTLSDEHAAYRSQVHGHFSNSAQLLDRLTTSYRDVYMHMAEGASSLCPDYISSQITLDRDTRSLLDRETGSTYRPSQESAPAPLPPLDYATRSSPDQKGSLAEDYGLDAENPDTDPPKRP